MKGVAWFAALNVGLLMFALSCDKDKNEDHARRLIPSKTAKCVTENGQGDSSVIEVSFCTDGKTLAICTDDDGCITVNLPAEAPAP